MPTAALRLLWTHRAVLGTLALALVLLVVGLVANRYLLNGSINVYDEGIILVGASRLLHGDLPYADFWSMYAPGQYAVLAALFACFGESVQTERVYDVVIRSLLPVAIFFAARRISSSRWAGLIAGVLTLMWLGCFHFCGYPIYVALLLMVISMIAWMRYVEYGRAQDLFCCGICVGLAGCFRQDFAGLYAVVLAVVVIVRQMGTTVAWRSQWPLAAGLAVVVVPVLMFLLVTCGWTTLIDQLLLTPATVMPAYRWLPYPSPWSLRVELLPFLLAPAVGILGVVVAVVLIARTDTRTRVVTSGLLLASLTCLVLLNQARVRSDLIHLLPSLLMAYLVGAILVLAWWTLGKRRWVKVVLRTASALLLAILTLPMAKPATTFWQHLTQSSAGAQPSGIERAGSAGLSRDLTRLLAYLREHTQPDDPIYIGVVNHDRFVINHVAITFLTQRRPASRYHELHPGVTTRADVQEAIIAELEAQQVRILVLTHSTGNEPNQSSDDAKIDLLDAYIREHYRQVERFGGYLVWERK